MSNCRNQKIASISCVLLFVSVESFASLWQRLDVVKSATTSLVPILSLCCARQASTHFAAAPILWRKSTLWRQSRLFDLVLETSKSMRTYENALRQSFFKGSR